MTPDEQKLRRAERFVWHLRASATMGSALSVLFFILAIPAFVFEARFVHSAIRASGVVTKIVPKDRNVRVVYAFHDANGVSYHGSDVCWPRVYTIGEKVDLLYVPGRTGARAEIVGFWNQWILTAFCLGGCLVIALGSLRLRSYYRSYRRRLDAWKAKAAVTS